MATWHFADTAYNPENITLPISTRVPGEDVMWALQGCMETFSSVAKNPASSPWIWSFQLRALIHFVGDVHQPLHNGQLFDHQFPNGDEGGNLYVVFLFQPLFCVAYWGLQVHHADSPPEPALYLG
mmetsp:Transcript_23011/g.58353  ORF Transcript_23011/g.58353 Transcript_23011/m.58353 type:complete len:125 (-) Transcript_23011:857-1231(-)